MHRGCLLVWLLLALACLAAAQPEIAGENFPLPGGLHHGDPVKRAEAIERLGDKRETRWLDTLLPLWRDPEPGVRVAVIRAVARIDGAGQFDFLFTAAMDADPQARAAALDALYTTGNGQTITRLLQYLTSPVSDDRQTAALALVACCRAHWVDEGMAARMVPALSAALRDPAPRVRALAIRALSRMKSDLLPAAIPIPAQLRPCLQDPDLDVRTAAALALRRWGETAPDAVFLAGLQATDPRIRLQAIQALAGRADGQCLEPLIALLPTPDQALRVEVVYTLGSLRDPRVFDALLPLLDDPDLALRRQVLMSLRSLCAAGLRDARVAARLQPLINDPSPLIRIDVARVLAALEAGKK